MDIHTADPFQTCLERLDEFLSSQIVQPNVSLRSGEEPRFERVKSDTLHGALGLAERRLGRMLRKLVNEDRFVGSCGRES